MILLKMYAPVNESNKYHSTPLRKALQRGHLRCARILLDNGATWDGVDIPRLLAYLSQDIFATMVVFLLENEAPLALDSMEAKNALLLACDQGRDTELRSLIGVGVSLRATD
eukprot:CAMPEP_0117435054 /NCGR_PEP_ID=MMETSP0759-20121206/274_1 /TAXON_ID=63605 /ORGANISM="Percolomonas cosmopolitus, Strain WS" /LENGTH=111 /DNA_ID=CAMNT_0005226571 /DNA_START=191 /DNA_END=523 /DNA_ORIENTATION=-